MTLKEKEIQKYNAKHPENYTLYIPVKSDQSPAKAREVIGHYISALKMYTESRPHITFSTVIVHKEGGVFGLDMFDEDYYKPYLECNFPKKQNVPPSYLQFILETYDPVTEHSCRILEAKHLIEDGWNPKYVFEPCFTRFARHNGSPVYLMMPTEFEHSWLSYINKKPVSPDITREEIDEIWKASTVEDFYTWKMMVQSIPGVGAPKTA